MTDYFVGIGGNDGNSGLTWALRKLTLNGAEDVPVVADDLVYVGPGAYREKLTADVSGGAGTEIVYVADTTGENTDGVGGIVRITGSDNDTAAARDHCLEGDAIDYRIFRGFLFDVSSSYLVHLTASCTNWSFEDCSIGLGSSSQIYIAGDSSEEINFLRCVISGPGASLSSIYFTVNAQDISSLIENCLFFGGYSYGVRLSSTGGLTVRNCLITGRLYGIRTVGAPPGGYTANVVENCIITGCRFGILANAIGEVAEDYNTFYSNTTDRTNTNVGGNSNTRPPLLQLPQLYSGAGQASGFKFPWWFGELSQWSQIAAITGNNEPVVDIWGTRRPATAAKNSWGPTQFRDMEAETGTVQAGTYARVLHDAGCVLARRIPVTGVEITVTLYVRRETNYAGNLPRMVIKQPGQADQITTMVAAVNTWEQLSDTFTPAALPGYVEVWVESRNTAVALAYEVFYDTMGVA